MAFPCGQCVRVLKSKDALKKHIERKHPKPLQFEHGGTVYVSSIKSGGYICPVGCSGESNYKERKDLWSHLAQAHDMQVHMFRTVTDNNPGIQFHFSKYHSLLITKIRSWRR